VAKEALCQAEEYLAAGVPVGKHLADQLMLPLGIGAHLGSGGGVFRTMGLSLHATTHLEILRRFLEIGIQVDGEDSGNCLVRFGYGP
jgi:RNA 3'-terminal phosphate cyclase (ATP)